jgi:isoquinoline 1-oxidoreductase beta subunit
LQLAGRSATGAAAGARSDGALAADAAKVPVPSDLELKDPKDWKLIGTRLPRIDGFAKTIGSTKYSIDVRQPGELIALVRRPKQFGAKVLSVDDRSRDSS